MNRISVIIINGKPRSGKDTVIEFMRAYCSINECARCHSYSTIDPVKNALRGLGWNGEKTNEVRDLLASLKQFWISNNDGPLKYCMDVIMKNIVNTGGDDVVLVFQIREPDEIAKLVNALEPIKLAYGLNVSTLFVNRPDTDGECYGNSADMHVTGYAYNDTIFNDGLLEDLSEAVADYMDNLLFGGKKSNEW